MPFELIHGPGPADADQTRRWLEEGCRSAAPIRQGFVAVLTHADGTVLAATSSRSEIALYYWVDGSGLRWSPTVPGLVRQLREPPPLDVGKLADLMALHDEPERTALEGVRRLPVGHRLTWRQGWSSPETERWFTPSAEEDRSIRPKDAAGLLRDAIRHAVTASLPSSGPVAATLSGGLDSSMVAGTAASVLAGSGRTVHALTHVPLPGTADQSSTWEADDGPYARRMVDEIPGLEWHPIVHDDRTSPLTTLAALFPTSWSPVLNPANMVWLTAAAGRAAELGSPLLLTGASGNAPFSRDRDGLVRQLVTRGRLDRLPAEVLRRQRAGVPVHRAARSVLAEAVGERTRELVRQHLLRIGPPPAYPSFIEAMPLRPETLSDAARRRLAALDGSTSHSQADWIDFVLRDGSLATVPPPDGIWWSDPLSDPEVVSLALRLPLEAWLQGGLDRGLARVAAEGLVPDHIRLRTTRGAQAADVGQWLHGREQEYRDLVDRLRASPAASTFIDLDRVSRQLESGLPSGRAAAAWEETTGRALGLGLFASWYEDDVLR
ncbi:asparagine synthase-related protein [Nocardioides bizhenqiangii]|uniref:asparagine synthase (glutamine-hydrolyzing) n=1 Tax=Nocardioides bizhenqiangii TaxID=3095076 RepID=A0ABZ0ZWQ8_9ACTN|nr:asparagine synthase-related protein [Nocardioides sp. HM61]WQQ28545.1 asparagine synthase-related protein [Nocardioides sp. HM61]